MAAPWTSMIAFLVLLIGSRDKGCVQFLQQSGQRVTEQLMRLAQAAALVERREFQILRLNAQAGGDVVADEVKPGELLGREGRAGLGLVHEIGRASCRE